MPKSENRIPWKAVLLFWEGARHQQRLFFVYFLFIHLYLHGHRCILGVSFLRVTAKLIRHPSFQYLSIRLFTSFSFLFFFIFLLLFVGPLLLLFATEVDVGVKLFCGFAWLGWMWWRVWVDFGVVLLYILLSLNLFGPYWKIKRLNLNIFFVLLFQSLK